MRSATFAILTSIVLPAALAAPLTTRDANPPICLTVCYFEKPECGELGYPYKWPGDDPANPCWTCCRDSADNKDWKPRSDSQETRNKNWKRDEDDDNYWSKRDEDETDWHKRSDGDGNEWGKRTEDDGSEWSKRSPQGDTWIERTTESQVTKRSPVNEWNARQDWKGEAQAQGENGWEWKREAQTKDGIEWTKESGWNHRKARQPQGQDDGWLGN